MRRKGTEETNKRVGITKHRSRGMTLRPTSARGASPAGPQQDGLQSSNGTKKALQALLSHDLSAFSPSHSWGRYGRRAPVPCTWPLVQGSHLATFAAFP